jgi:DNA repair protein RecO (recombination protein O)
MEWKDSGFVLAVRKHGETSAIVELMTERHGRHLGLVRGGRSSRMRPLLQPGNSLHAEWRARLEEHLGTYRVEADELRAASLMQLPLGMYGLQVAAAHLRLLPERESAGGLYRAALVLLGHLDEPEKAARLMIRFELAILDELGFGLDLDQCAATGTREELVWVSPRSGRAVSREAGRPHEAQLLSLPAFLTGSPPNHIAPSEALEQGFRLTGYFLDRNVYGVRGVKPPEERAGFIRKVVKALE